MKNAARNANLTNIPTTLELFFLAAATACEEVKAVRIAIAFWWMKAVLGDC